MHIHEYFVFTMSIMIHSPEVTSALSSALEIHHNRSHSKKMLIKTVGENINLVARLVARILERISLFWPKTNQ